MELENVLTITKCPNNGVVWGSIDPYTGDLLAYPEETNQKIEEGYQAFQRNPDLKHIDLPNYYNSRIHYCADGEFYQTTKTNGYRGVFRESFEGEEDKGNITIMKSVKYEERLHAWYLKRDKATHIGFLVDTSTSMCGFYENVIEKGVDEFLEKQKTDITHNIKFYGMTFASNSKLHYSGENLKELPSQEVRNTFCHIKPRGSTAFYDSLLELITLINQKYREGDEVIICSVTDGYDNTSTQSPEYLKAVIQKKRQMDWMFILFGTDDIDIDSLCHLTGIPKESALTIGKSNDHTGNAYQCLSRGIERVRTGEMGELSFTNLERNISYGKSPRK